MTESRLVQIIKKYNLFLGETPQGAEDIEWLVREVERLRLNMGNWEIENERAQDAEEMRDHWKRKYDALCWQIRHDGCARNDYGERGTACGFCDLCRLRKSYAQTSADRS